MKKLCIMLVTVFFLAMCMHPCLSFADSSSEGNRRAIHITLPTNVYYQDQTLYVFVRYVSYGDLVELFNQMKMVSYKRVVIDLFSFGGSVFDALAMVGLLEEQERQGRIIEIRAKGIVASAGLIIMMSGTPGYRFIDKNTFVMFHEMQSIKFFAIESVSDQEEQSKINRKIQDAVNRYITAKTKLTPDKLSELIKKKELWCDAIESVEYGFADKVTGDVDQK